MIQEENSSSESDHDTVDNIFFSVFLLLVTIINPWEASVVISSYISFAS